MIKGLQSNNILTLKKSFIFMQPQWKCKDWTENENVQGWTASERMRGAFLNCVRFSVTSAFVCVVSCPQVNCGVRLYTTALRQHPAHYTRRQNLPQRQRCMTNIHKFLCDNEFQPADWRTRTCARACTLLMHLTDCEKNVRSRCSGYY